MNILRIIKHLSLSSWYTRHFFSPECLERIERLIADSEATHRGELRLAIEACLPIGKLSLSPKERAVEVFSDLHVWDTEENTGVLLYILLADRKLEIIADRGVHARVGEAAWTAIAHEVEQLFREEQFEAGLQLGIELIEKELMTHFPADGEVRNELPNAPELL